LACHVSTVGRAGDGIAVEIEHPALHVERNADAIEADVGAERQPRRISAVEGTAHGVRGGALRAARVDLLHQRADAEKVGKQYPFLPLVVAGMADFGQEFDSAPPVGLGRPRFPDGLVHMPDQRSQKGRQRADALRQPLDHKRCRIRFRERRGRHGSS